MKKRLPILILLIAFILTGRSQINLQSEFKVGRVCFHDEDWGQVLCIMDDRSVQIYGDTINTVMVLLEQFSKVRRELDSIKNTTPQNNYSWINNHQ
jgi:hypothetical protein